MEKRSTRRLFHILVSSALSIIGIILFASFGMTYADTMPGDSHEWEFSTFGVNTSLSNSGYEIDPDAGSVRVFSKDSSGKLVPWSTDGVSFYYTSIDPDSENFILRAKANVNSWYYTNGQEGFGLMAADRVGENGNSNPFWNNSYMACITKVSYLWDGTKVSNSGEEIMMRLGVAAQEKKGVTPDAIMEDYSLKDMSLFSRSITPLDLSCVPLGGGTYNIVGNYTNKQAPPGTVAEPETTFDLCIEKNNTGYFVSYTDQNGDSIVKKYYDPDALRALDPDHVYIGFFTSKTADITFTDISFTTSDPQTDPPAEEQPVSLVDPLYQIMSASTSNSSAYKLVFLGNADGMLNITNNGEDAYTGPVTAGKRTDIPISLTAGSNHLEIVMTPDENYRPSEHEMMSTYDPAVLTHLVTYDAYADDPIYVSPDGTDTAQGTKDDPASIYSAVSKAAPGQTIYLRGGTYLMNKSLVISRGLDGTAKAPITLAADPGAAARPVLDFQKKSAGLVLAADYWHLKGFDVTRSKDLEGGIRVCGSNNTLELVNAYKNGDTGIWICTYSEKYDSREDWPANNFILNCTSMMNADSGHEDADGFAAKVTCAEGNVFDGCIACYNADDGWDLFAKANFGQIGKVVIRNCVAYKNGYILSDDGTEIIAGNGNGFKLGGESFSGRHTVINSIAFGNRTMGINSNTCPDVSVKGCTLFNNEGKNLNLYGGLSINTDFSVDGVLSYSNIGSVEDFILPKGTQNRAKYTGNSNYYYKGGKSVNSNGLTADSTWFVSTDMKKAVNGGITRNADGSINMNGFLELTAKVPAGTGARFGTAEPPADGKPSEGKPSEVKNGSIYEVSQGQVRVISVKDKTVAFIKANKGKKKINVPKTVKINAESYTVIEIGTKAFNGSKAVTVTVSENIMIIRPGAFKKSKVKKLIIKSRKLTKKAVKGSLKSSKVKKLTINTGNKKLRKKYLKKYKKIFTSKNAGRKVKLSI